MIIPQVLQREEGEGAGVDTKSGKSANAQDVQQKLESGTVTYFT